MARVLGPAARVTSCVCVLPLPALLRLSGDRVCESGPARLHPHILPALSEVAVARRRVLLLAELNCRTEQDNRPHVIKKRALRLGMNRLDRLCESGSAQDHRRNTNLLLAELLWLGRTRLDRILLLAELNCCCNAKIQALREVPILGAAGPLAELLWLGMTPLDRLSGSRTEHRRPATE